jgi:hypothetical protein
MLWPTVSRPVCLGVKTQDQIFITFRQLWVCWCAMPSLTRGRVCSIQFHWPSSAQLFSGPSPALLMTIFYCLRFENPPTRRARSPSLHPLGTGCPSYTPRHWVLFSSPPTTHRVMVEVFGPASTRASSAMFSYALSLCSSISTRDQTSQIQFSFM